MGYTGPDDLFQAEYRTLDKNQYVHIFVVGILFAAFDAYGIGSNDVVRVPSSTCELEPFPHSDPSRAITCPVLAHTSPPLSTCTVRSNSPVPTPPQPASRRQPLHTAGTGAWTHRTTTVLRHSTGTPALGTVD
jgi:hypothetical protein